MYLGWDALPPRAAGPLLAGAVGAAVSTPFVPTVQAVLRANCSTVQYVTAAHHVSVADEGGRDAASVPALELLLAAPAGKRQRTVRLVLPGLAVGHAVAHLTAVGSSSQDSGQDRPGWGAGSGGPPCSGTGRGCRGRGSPPRHSRPVRYSAVQSFSAVQHLAVLLPVTAVLAGQAAVQVAQQLRHAALHRLAPVVLVAANPDIPGASSGYTTPTWCPPPRSPARRHTPSWRGDSARCCRTGTASAGCSSCLARSPSRPTRRCSPGQ